MKERVIKYKGLDLKLNIDIDNIIDNVKEQYKPEVENLRKLIKKRHKYIHELHQLIKNKDVTMFMMVNAVKISRKMKKAYEINDKQAMILSYMYDVNMAKMDPINRYLETIHITKALRMDMDYLIDMGYIIKTSIYGYYGITDKGKRIIESVYNAYRQDYAYFIENRPSKRNYYYKAKGSKYSEQELEKRSQLYRQMMMPFWDGGFKVMPKDVNRRVDYLLEWIQQRKEKGMVVDPYYMKLVEKWSAAPKL